MRLCDKCIHGCNVCVATTSDVRTENDIIVACDQFLLDPVYEFEQEMTKALQVLVKRGRIKKAWVVRSGHVLQTRTEPEIPEGEIVEMLKQGDYDA